MDREEMIRMIEAISDYLETKDESPLASRDLHRVIPELERLWKLEEEKMNGEELFLISKAMQKEKKETPPGSLHPRVLNALIVKYDKSGTKLRYWQREGTTEDDLDIEAIKSDVLDGTIWNVRGLGPVGIKQVCLWLEAKGKI